MYCSKIDIRQLQGIHYCFVEIYSAYFVICLRNKPSRSVMVSFSRIYVFRLYGQKLTLFVPYPLPQKIKSYRVIMFADILYMTVEKSFRL